MAELVNVRLAYADPPYPGKAHLYPENTEVDHAELIAQLATFDGWALSTDSPALSYVLGLCPDDVHVAAWIRTNAPPFNPDGRGAVRSWEPVVYSPARVDRFAPDRVRDTFASGAPTGTIGAGLTGAKPPGDTFVDLFPGTGVMGRAWIDHEQQPSLFAAAIGGPRSGEYHAPGRIALPV